MSVSLNEGSVYKCDSHDFETSDQRTWLNHIINLEHFDEGSSKCIYCNRKVKYDKLERANLDYTAPAICYYCAAKNETQHNAKLVTIKIRPDSTKEECRGF